MGIKEKLQKAIIARGAALQASEQADKQNRERIRQDQNSRNKKTARTIQEHATESNFVHIAQAVVEEMGGALETSFGYTKPGASQKASILELDKDFEPLDESGEIKCLWFKMTWPNQKNEGGVNNYHIISMSSDGTFSFVKMNIYRKGHPSGWQDNPALLEDTLIEEILKANDGPIIY